MPRWIAKKEVYSTEDISIVSNTSNEFSGSRVKKNLSGFYYILSTRFYI